MGRRTVSKPKYLRWLTPAEALARLPKEWGEQSQRRWIADLLQDGRLGSAARDVTDSAGRPKYLLLAWSDWLQWPYGSDDHFWLTGNRTDAIANTPDGRGGIYASAPFKAFGVRFDPAPFDQLDEERHARSSQNLGKILDAIKPSIDLMEARLAAATTSPKAPRPAAEPPLEAAPTLKRPKATKKELCDWYDGQFPENPRLPYHEVKRRAEAHFRPRPVTRRILESVIADRGHTLSQGNPLIPRK